MASFSTRLVVFASLAAHALAAVTRTGGTLVLRNNAAAFPGSECVTFRNNGEMVEAACVNSAVDRQITAGTTSAGVAVLFVERQFGAAQAARLVGKEPCVGFNGTHFRAEDCNALTAPVSFVGGQLTAGAACSTGTNGKAELVVSTTGGNCAVYSSATVARTLDNAGTLAPATGGEVAAPVVSSTRTRRPRPTRPAAPVVVSAPAPVATSPPIVDAPVVTPPASGTASSNAAVTRTGSTVVLRDVNAKFPGSECMTFRNNGEIVEAACVNAAVDRQVTPGTTASGLSVLFVERQFGQAQAARLVGKQPCVGFNGTHFRAEDCNALAAPVTFVGGQLVAGAACITGTNAKAELAASATGGNCATFTSQVVPRTLDNAGTLARRFSRFVSRARMVGAAVHARDN